MDLLIARWAEGALQGGGERGVRPHRVEGSKVNVGVSVVGDKILRPCRGPLGLAVHGIGGDGGGRGGVETLLSDGEQMVGGKTLYIGCHGLDPGGDRALGAVPADRLVD